MYPKHEMRTSPSQHFASGTSKKPMERRKLSKWATTGNPDRQRYNRQARQVADHGKMIDKANSLQAKYDLLSSLPPRTEGLGKRDRYGEGKTQADRPTDLNMFSCGTFATIIGHVFDLRHS